MIEHLRGRDRKLELLGWTGRDAEWIALVCLHSGVFTRAQFCQYFDTTNRVRAQRFVKALIDRKQAVEIEWPIMNGGAKTCRISSKAIYRALGVENIRHRRQASNLVVMRRLLSLDFVLEHPGMNWLPAEPEKVEFFEEIGLPLRLIPRLKAEIGVGLADRHQPVHLIGKGEVVPCLGRGFADRPYRPIQAGENFGGGNQPVSFTLHGFIFSHARQTEGGHRSGSYTGFPCRSCSGLRAREVLAAILLPANEHRWDSGRVSINGRNEESG